MKKVLTVLLAIAVVFTFSFGSTVAFADSDDAKAYVADNQAKYYDKIDEAAKAINVAYDADGYLAKKDGTPVTYSGYVTKALVEADLADAVDAAKTVLNQEIGKIDYEATNTSALAMDALDSAYMTALNKLNTEFLSDWADLLEKQLKADKSDAYALFAKYDTANYSANSKDWSKKIADDEYFDEQKLHYKTTKVTGLEGGKEYPAKTIVKNLLDKQNDVVTEADGTTAEDYKKAIDTVRTAMDTVKDILDGHKIGEGTAAYYVEAIPTIEGLKGDTSLADKKANAIAVVTANLSAKQVEMAETLQKAIDDLDKQAKLSKDETKLLNKLKSLKASLADDFANIKEVATAQINYQETTSSVDNFKNRWNNAIAGLTADGATADGYVDNTKSFIANCADWVKWVKDLKADAEVLKSLKNVNGLPYYDAEQLAESLDDAIEAVYMGECDTYNKAYIKLTTGNDAALIDAKITYTKIVEGKMDTMPANIKDSDGNRVTTDWNKASDTVKIDNNRTVSSLDSYVADKAGKVAVYDKAQKAELKALVSETTKAIEEAKTIAEVESIFKTANDKYADIKTKADHYADWNTGKINTAYDKADYAKELRAYAGYFAAKAGSDYLTMTADEVLQEVAYPVVYEAYTVDELAGKVADAKAAIDAIKTKDQLKADKAAVEALIKALPATNAVALTDKDAIVKAADALDDYNDTFGPGKNPVTNTAKLDAVKEAYEKLDADAVEDAYDALDVNNVTIDSEAAIKALRDAFDAHNDFCEDYKVTNTLTTVTEKNVSDLEDALSTAKVNNVKKLMAQLPANPAYASKAQVEAVKAAYDALTLEEKALIVSGPYYNAMIDAIEALGLNATASVEELKITAKSSAKKGSITVKWTVKGDASAVDGYEVWKSTKHSKGYKKAFTTKKQSYKNTKGLKKGTRYYYKVRAYKMVDGKKITSDWSNKARRVAK